ncbi:hypothetical protein HNR62_002538 [Oceanisphaera litoralis]|nr:hypothetical protein [Oceanisphaera litoralis]
MPKGRSNAAALIIVAIVAIVATMTTMTTMASSKRQC